MFHYTPFSAMYLTQTRRSNRESHAERQQRVLYNAHGSAFMGNPIRLMASRNPANRAVLKAILSLKPISLKTISVVERIRTNNIHSCTFFELNVCSLSNSFVAAHELKDNSNHVVFLGVPTSLGHT